MARKYFIETYGCQMNFHDSERLAGLLDQAGLEPTVMEAEADVIVINTCSVRERAEEKLYTRLGEIREADRDNGRARIVAVAGCVAQQEAGALLKGGRGVDVVVGTQSLTRLPMLIETAASQMMPVVDVNPYDDVSFPLGVVRRGDTVRALVTIIEGCNEFCSFCVVPYTRGHERMRPKRHIVEEVRRAVGEGHPEIQLLGQIVNHYQAPDDPTCDFAGLLEAVHEVPGVERIRFASPHPRHVTRRLIDSIQALPKVCRHLHLPVQSGSNSVLEAMRRRYTRESYLELVAAIRSSMPEIALSTDMIVGFPGETTADFADTLSLVSTVRFSSMFSFKYSPRPNTLALKRLPDDVSEAEKTQRIVSLQALQRDIQLAMHADAVGRDYGVLVESTSRRRAWELSGRTEGNTVVNFPGPETWIGRTIGVRITRAGANSLSGVPSGPTPLDTGNAQA